MSLPPAVPASLGAEYRVRFDEAGADGALRDSGYLRWAQDMAWRHSASAGLDREWYAERGMTWLIRAVELTIDGRVEYGASLHVTTEIAGFRRVLARRRTTFSAPDGSAPATALTDWVLINERGLPTRIPAQIGERFAADVGQFEPLKVALPPTPGDASWRELAVRASEVDPLGHVNNAAYIDYLVEHLGGDAVTALPRRYRGEFLLPAERGMELSAAAWPDVAGTVWSYRLADGGGRELFRARLEIGSAGGISQAG